MLVDTALHRACYEGQVDIVSHLLEMGCDSSVEGQGGTPLQHAGLRGHLPIVQVGYFPCGKEASTKMMTL